MVMLLLLDAFCVIRIEHLVVMVLSNHSGLLLARNAHNVVWCTRRLIIVL